MKGSVAVSSRVGHLELDVPQLRCPAGRPVNGAPAVRSRARLEKSRSRNGSAIEHASSAVSPAPLLPRAGTGDLHAVAVRVRTT